MKKIDTSTIAAGVAYPPSKKGFDFLQQSYQQILAAIAQGVAGQPTVGGAYALYGCVETDLGAGNFSYTEGYIYDSVTAEVYYFPAVASIAIATAPVLTITTTPDPTADPTTFTDGSIQNVHDVRTLVLSNGALGSADIDYDDVIQINQEWKSYTPTITASTYADVAVTAPTVSANSYTYKILGNTLFINGYSTGVTTVATTAKILITLPSDIRLTGKGKYGTGAVNYDKASVQGSGLSSFASIRLTSGGAGYGLTIVKSDGSDYGVLTTYQFHFTITIALT